MCRNITVLRGLEPPATAQELHDAARQFVRKIAGLQSPTQLSRDDVQLAIDQIAFVTGELLRTLPARRTAPTGPPGRRGTRDVLISRATRRAGRFSRYAS